MGGQPAEEVAFKMKSEDEKELAGIGVGESARSQAMERSEFRVKRRAGLDYYLRKQKEADEAELYDQIRNPQESKGGDWQGKLVPTEPCKV